MKDKEK
jgi:NIMA (never in mitosis gene a)-related kinase 2